MKESELFMLVETNSMFLGQVNIEKMADFVHKDDHPEIGKIKDISAAACLIISVSALVIGVLLYLPKIIPFL